MKYEKRHKQGSISLEACVVVPIFMILILFIYSFFVVFTAQNSIAHALLQCSQSVSLDPYKTENLGMKSDELPDDLTDIVSEILDGDNPNFVSDSKWYTNDGSLTFGEATIDLISGGFLTPKEEATVTGFSSEALKEAIKNRFVGYLAGGDTEKAKKDLEALHVVNGLDGITFTAAVCGEDLYITATYKIEYVFSFQGTAQIQMSQTVCSHLWK